MVKKKESKILVYSGGSPGHSSEKVFLERLHKDLSGKNVEALIFATFYAGQGEKKREIDFLVVTHNCACVVELKNYTTVVCGEYNGPWELKMPDGSSIKKLDEKNPYRQGRDAKYSLSNAMHDLQSKEPSIPPPAQGKEYFHFIECVICIYPEIVHGSDIPNGDYRTWIRVSTQFYRF